MSPSNRVKITAYLVTGVWSVVILVAGIKLSGTLTKALTSLPIAVVLIFAIFDYWLWRVGPIKTLVKRPNLNGTWKGTLTSLRADGSGQEVAHAPIPIFLVVRQSYLDLSITLLSQESRLQRGAVVPGPDGRTRSEVSIELLFDPPGHVRLPIEDDELVDRALAIQPLAGRQVTVLTYDTGQSTRARNAGLQVVKLRKESGEEPTEGS